jgi:tetratricopeptide (TPR) repeat protein
MADISLDELEKRVAKLEKGRSVFLRFCLQYLVSPIIVVAIGFYFNSKLEEQKAQVMQFKLAQEAMPALFSGDPYLGFAAQSLIHRAVADQDLSTEMENLVGSYYLNRLKMFMDAGDAESATKIVQAAKAVGGDFGNQFVAQALQDKQRAATLGRYEKAVAEERKAFQSLIDRRYDEAIAAFEAAETAYPEFHQTYEIARLLRSRRAHLDDPTVRRDVYQQIVRDLSWKAPPDLLERMRQAAEGSN